MLKLFFGFTLLFCFSAGTVCLAHAEDVREMQILLPPPDGTNGFYYAVGSGHAKSGDLAAVTRFRESKESGDLSITKAFGVYGDVHTARTIAIQTARLQLANNLRTHVTVFGTPERHITDFERHISDLFTDLTSMTNNVLIGARVIKTVITQQDGEHTVQVLMAMPIKLNVAHLSVKEMNKEIYKTREEIYKTRAIEMAYKAWSLDQISLVDQRPETKDLDLQQVVDATAAYPEWFWNLPADLPFPTAVGYSSIAAGSDLALEQAIDNGIENLAKQTHIHISGLIKFFHENLTNEVNRAVTSVFREQIDAAVSEYIKKKHEVLATHRGEIGTIVLVSLGKTSDLSSLTPDVNTTPPEWVTQLPSLPWYLYAHGVSSINPLPNEAWLEAEKDARAQLALSFEAKSTGISKSFKEQDGTSSLFSETSETFTDVTLSGIETVSRWYDAEQRVCHVLIRAPIIQSAPITDVKEISQDYQQFDDWKVPEELEKRQDLQENKDKERQNE